MKSVVLKPTVYFVVAFCILLFCVAPLVTLLTKASPQSFLLAFAHPNTLKAFINTGLLAGSCALVCTLIGVPLAWLIARTDLRFTGALKNLLMLPYAIPAYVGAIGWIVLANPQSGLLNQWLGHSYFNVYSFAGLVFVESSFLFTFSFLIALSSLEKMDPSYEEAARISGASGLRVFFDISLPILKPAIFSSFILVFLATAASFGVPALIGSPARIYFLTTQIFTYQKMATENGIQMALALSGLLMLSSLVLLFASQYFLRNSSASVVSGKTSRPSQVPLGLWRDPILFFVALFILIVFVAPILSLLLSSLSPIQGRWDLSQLSLINFHRVLIETEETQRALLNSVKFGVGVAAGLAGIAFLISYFIAKSNFKGRKLVEVFSSVPFSTPGTVVALALIVSFSSGFWGLGPSLYNTFALLFIAYSVKYLSLSIKTIRDGFDQIDKSLEEAAQVSGASWLRIMMTIYFPLLKPVILAAFFLVFMPVFSELTMSALLTGPGLETIGTMIYQMQEYSDMSGGGAAVLSLLVVVIVLILVAILNLLSRKRI